MTAIHNTSKILTHWMNIPLTLSEKDFFEQFGVGDAKQIGTDEKAYSEDISITSFDIGDCITLFAIEKEAGKIKAVIGWHIGDDTSVEDLKGDEYLDAFITGNSVDSDESDSSEDLEETEPQIPQKTYDLYIIGGTKHTTEGHGCLLSNIHQAIEEFFFKRTFTIKKELVNLNAGTINEFVSANLQIDGTLTFCCHKNRHY
jgi:hypothetical protein